MIILSELLRRVETRPVREANPKLEVSVKIVNDYGNPSVNLTYGSFMTKDVLYFYFQIKNILLTCTYDNYFSRWPRTQARYKDNEDCGYHGRN